MDDDEVGTVDYGASDIIGADAGGSRHAGNLSHGLTADQCKAKGSHSGRRQEEFRNEVNGTR